MLAFLRSLFGFDLTIDSVVADISHKVTQLKTISDDAYAEAAELKHQAMQLQIEAVALVNESTRAARLASKFEELVS